MKKIFSCMAAICLSVSFLQAQLTPPVAPELPYVNVEITGESFTVGGAYYVFNVGSSRFLNRGASYGQQAVVAATGLLTTIGGAAEAYTLSFQGGGTLFRTNDGWTYTDNTSNNTWNLALVDGTSDTYTIQVPSNHSHYNADQYLASALGSDVVNYTRSNSVYAKWKFVSTIPSDYTTKYTTAKNVYDAAVAAYPEAVALYEAKKGLYNLITFIGENTEITIDVASYTTAYNTATTSAEVETARQDLKAELLTYYSAQTTTPQVDMTDKITNPSFEVNGLNGWIKVGGTSEFVAKTDNGPGNVHGTTYAQDWNDNDASLPDFNLYQTITGLDNGPYTLKALVGATQGSGNPENVYIYAGDDKVEATAQTLAEVTLTTIVTDGTLTIGFKAESRTARWAFADNFRLYYDGPVAEPIITPISDVVLDETTTAVDLFVQGLNLTEDLTIALGKQLAGVSVSTMTVSKEDAIAGVNVTFTYNPSLASVSDYTTITLSSEGAEDKVVKLIAKKESYVATYPTAKNYIKDPTVSDPTLFAGGWGNRSIVNIQTDDVYAGYACGKVDGKENCWPNGGSFLTDLDGVLEANTDYVILAWVKLMDGDFNIGLSTEAAGKSGVDLRVYYNDENWEQVRCEFTTGNNPTQGSIFFNNCGTVEGDSDAGKVAYIDNWELYKKSDTQVIPSSVENTLVNSYRIHTIKNAIVVDAQEAMQVNVFSVTGQLVKQANALVGRTTIELVAGMYIVNGQKVVVK